MAKRDRELIADNSACRLKSETAAFWDGNPCDGEFSDVDRLIEYRFLKEPWLKDRLKEIGNSQSSILEVGSGQGTDAILIGSNMRQSCGSYFCLDYSKKSLEKCKANIQDFCASNTLSVKYSFLCGDAENLPFEDGSIGFVYSMGVLHHTEDTLRAIAEINRCLMPGGSAQIYLYRTLSPKLLVAHGLRIVQRLIDVFTFGERRLFRLLKRLPSGYTAFFGTAFHECFGVPILRSYTRSEIERMFSDFEVKEFRSVGSGLPPAIGWANRLPWLNGKLGYFWEIKVTKCRTVAPTKP